MKKQIEFCLLRWLIQDWCFFTSWSISSVLFFVCQNRINFIEMTTAKVRDSYKVIHVFRNHLYESSHQPKIIHRSEEAIIDTDLTKTKKFSVTESSHYTNYSLKNLYSKNEHYLLDVEDLDRVYRKMRDEIKIPRPKVLIDRGVNYFSEFEKRMKEDLDFRERVLKANERHLSRRAKSVAARPHDSYFRHGTIHELPEESLSSENGSPIGKYSYKVQRLRGNKVSYEVVAFAKKSAVAPHSDEKRPESEKDKSSTSRSDKIEIIKDEKAKEDQQEFYEISIHKFNPFKRKGFYVPLKDEEIHLEERMLKRWNPPKWKQFTTADVWKATSTAFKTFDKIIGESEKKLLRNRANTSLNDYTDTSIIEDAKNLSAIEDVNDISFNREFAISLKTSSPVKPNAKLLGLHEKLEERRKLFGRTLTHDFDKKDIVTTIRNKITEYSKNAKNLAKDHARQASNKQAFSPPNRLLKHRGTIVLKPSDLDNKRNSLSREATHDESSLAQRRASIVKSSAKRAQADKVTRPDATPSDVFLTQMNSISEVNDGFTLNLQRVDSHIAPSTLKVELAKQSTFAESDSQIPGNEDQLSGISQVNKAYNKLKSGNNDVTSRQDTRSQSSKQVVKELPLRFLKTSKDYRKQRARSVDVPCEELEYRLNQTCQEFMKIKIEANEKYKAALDSLQKDRPITNMIRYRKYDAKKMYLNDINDIRSIAEKERMRRFEMNESQRIFYSELLDTVVKIESNEKRLKACNYLLSLIKNLLERGDILTRETFSKILDKIDDEDSINKVFLIVVDKIMNRLKFPIDMINNKVLREKLEQFKVVQPDNKSR